MDIISVLQFHTIGEFFFYGNTAILVWEILLKYKLHTLKEELFFNSPIHPIGCGFYILYYPISLLLSIIAAFFPKRNFEHLIPDAPELIHDFLVNEKDASCKRNAFMMLIHADQVKI